METEAKVVCTPFIGDTIWLLNKRTGRYERVVVLSIDLHGGAMDVYRPSCKEKRTAGKTHKGVSVLSPDVRTSKSPGEPVSTFPNTLTPVGKGRGGVGVKVVNVGSMNRYGR